LTLFDSPEHPKGAARGIVG